MDGLDGTLRRKRTLKERLGIGMGCCGGSRAFGPTSMSVRDDDEEDEELPQQQNQQQQIQVINTSTESVQVPDCVSPAQIQTSSGMNLAAALAAERQFRASNEPEEPLIRSINDSNVGQTDDDPTVGITRPGTPLRVSLMRLLDLTADRGDQGEVVAVGTEKEAEGGGVVAGNDSVCCVCMVRKKGAAFIPCGHTFCRVCTRELWLTRGSCPLCNRLILEILDIF
ncbi:hypothetical protein HS088_TW09G00180 [Tripterygium wilfordii]|uniref:RING-type domain-containing protein n=2 Tax=Tripterygium wilfordii TaxID=458696 RepID=A0A7J7D758_TRIWF|nr:uncharacterized protein LOC120005088 isoform X2 [Tripterygium wilfordii]KAF5742138.1 hypothetical protein HS088_TW09G00180 [Tripterygium wilfordii]